MKKNILKLVFASAFALVAGYSIHASQQNAEMSDLALANVEALANRESNPLCPNGCLTTPGYCYCYISHPYEEAKWK